MCVILLSLLYSAPATTEIYTLSLHDALPISRSGRPGSRRTSRPEWFPRARWRRSRSEEHTSELQSRQYLVCRLLLEKKKHRPPPGAEPTHTGVSDEIQRQEHVPTLAIPECRA